ncbi:MAG: argininosuccinate lyase, partial [Candidatus Margulisbacteria bacterium]|nr:argininosuccinate lyase [Candidatus Margulisiibacteriota bacterium]
MKKKPWSGRFRTPMAESAEIFSSSIKYDVRLYKHDIVQNIAYAGALLKAKVLSSQECNKIIKALEEILKGIEKGSLKLKPELEDIHMNIESALIDKIGDIGKKLHAGRSRNDQVATDARLMVKYETTEIIFMIKKLQAVIVNLADENLKVIMPGYT